MLHLAMSLLLAQDVTWIETRFHRVHLRNGNFIDGQLLSEKRGLVLLRLEKGGEFGVRRDMIKRVEFITLRSIQEAPVILAAPRSSPAAEIEAAAPPITVTSTDFSADAKRAVEAALRNHAATRSGVRRSLGERLKTLGPDALAYACWLARHGRPPIERAELVEALGACEGPAVLAALTEIAHASPDSFARAAAVRALSRHGSPEAAAAVRKALGDPAGPVWRVALDAVVEAKKKGSLDVESLIQAMAESPRKEHFMAALSRVGGEAALDAVQERLREGDAAEKIGALRALAEHRRPEDAEVAAPLLDNEDPDLRREACLFMGKAKAGGAVGALVALLSDDVDSVADAAHWALRQISGQTYARTVELWNAWWESSGRAQFPPFED